MIKHSLQTNTSTLPLNLNVAGLHEHVLACRRAREHAFELRCLAERLHAVLAPRLVTTLFSATALLGLLLAIS